MDKYLARDIRHAIAEEMAKEGLLWGGRQDYAAGAALARVSLPAEPVAVPTPVEETQEKSAMTDPLAPALAYLERMKTFPGQNDSLDHLRAVCAALTAYHAATNRMRAALVEAQEELARGQIMHAQAAIKRGLAE